MDNYEKNVDKALNAVEKVSKAANRVQAGCITILANLFFAGFCLWGVYAGYVSWTLEQSGERTTGNVVQLEESNSSEGGCCVYSPVIEFTADGQTYSFESDNASDLLHIRSVRKCQYFMIQQGLRPRKSTASLNAGCFRLLSSLP